jgi:hypothetical protein
MEAIRTAFPDENLTLQRLPRSREMFYGFENLQGADHARLSHPAREDFIRRCFGEDAPEAQGLRRPDEREPAVNAPDTAEYERDILSDGAIVQKITDREIIHTINDDVGISH